MKIYIAGKISGLLKEEYLPKFEKVENELRAAGWDPVNPCNFGIPDHTPSAEALEICLPELEKCPAIYMLSDWRESFGAIIEHNAATHKKMDIYYEEWHPVGHMKKVREEVL